jgi:hypothetical protein
MEDYLALESSCPELGDRQFMVNRVVEVDP